MEAVGIMPVRWMIDWISDLFNNALLRGAQFRRFPPWKKSERRGARSESTTRPGVFAFAWFRSEFAAAR